MCRVSPSSNPSMSAISTVGMPPFEASAIRNMMSRSRKSYRVALSGCRRAIAPTSHQLVLLAAALDDSVEADRCGVVKVTHRALQLPLPGIDPVHRLCDLRLGEAAAVRVVLLDVAEHLGDLSFGRRVPEPGSQERLLHLRLRCLVGEETL